MPENDTQQTGDADDAQRRLDQLNDALLEAYAAGFAKGAEFVEAEPDFDTDVQTLKEKEPVRESHYYYWDGQPSKIEMWLREQVEDPDPELVTDGGTQQTAPFHDPEEQEELPDREEWDNVEPLEDDDSDSYDVYIVCVADADGDATFKKDAYLAYTDKNAKFQAFYAVKDSYSRPKVYHCERVAEDV